MAESAKLQLIRKWLDEAQESNAIGNAKGDLTFPRRLISIPSEPLCKTSLLKLIETTNVRPQKLSKMSYVTLSHRWGISKKFGTTKATIGDRSSSGVRAGDFPNTYLDAATITQKLGFRYLWIDAICIVQDDEADWRLESEKMGAIYHSAAFTIAAHCSGNDDAGFLEAAMTKRPASRIPYDSEGLTGCNWEIYACQIPNFDADVCRSTLSSRGWVLQERLLVGTFRNRIRCR